MFIFDSASAKLVKTNTINIKCSFFQGDIQKCKLSVADYTEKLKYFYELEKKTANYRNYDNAEIFRYIYEILLTKKMDIDKYTNAETDAKIKRNYKEAILMKIKQNQILTDIEKMLAIIPICHQIFQENDKKSISLDFNEILKSFYELEKKTANNQNYDEAYEAKYIFDFLLTKKTEYNKCFILEYKAKNERNYKQAKILKSYQDKIMNDIKQLLTIEPEIILVNIYNQGQNQISASNDYSLALNDGKVIWWGWSTIKTKLDNWEVNLQGECVTMISAGLNHSLALTNNGKVIQCGQIVCTNVINIPEHIQGLTIMISAGDNYSMALTHDGKVICWGANDNKQCNVPENIQGQTSMISTRPGAHHALALTRNNKVTCWGDNSRNQCDVPDIQEKITMISAGWNHSMALTHNGKVICWGDSSHKLLDIPECIQGQTIAISAGSCHSMALTYDGKVTCWGANDHGECDVPENIQWNISKISAGLHHSIALTIDNKVICWGTNVWGICNVPESVR